MCGIAGIVSTIPGQPPLPDAAQVVARMAAKMAHRGPDGSGVWSDPTGAVHFAHRRLAVIDLSPDAAQPMVDTATQLAITFTGEIYNYRELRDELIAAGHAFRTQSDTEVILKAYAQWGRDCVRHLVGMFAFAIHDGGQQQLLLARDRAGEKPLYWAPIGRIDGEPAGFAFASEFQPLADVVGTSMPPFWLSTARYLRFSRCAGASPTPHEIYSLAPATTMVLFPGAVSPVSSDNEPRYWDPLSSIRSPQVELTDREAEDELLRLLRESVRGQMISDVPIGAFLSGGIDSSLIVALMQEQSRQPIRTFTIGFDDAAFDESSHAAAVAGHLGTDHTCERLRISDARDLIEQIPAIYGEPFGDSSALPTILVSRVARQHVTVCLSGDGGDEAFGGYARYASLERQTVLRGVTSPLRWLFRVLGRADGARWARAAWRLGRSRQEFETDATAVLSDTIAASLCGESDLWRECTLSADAFERWRSVEAQTRRLTPRSLSLRRRLMLDDLVDYLPNDILTKVDRAAMSCSLETRAPFLDHRVLEFSLRLPDHLVKNKLILRRLAERFVPKELLDRPKKGFSVPLARWFRGELRPMLERLLVPEFLAPVGVTGQKMVNTLLRQHLSGKRDWSHGLYALLILALWSEQNRP